MNKTIKFLMILIASVSITSCVQDDDYTVPNSLGNEENVALQNIINNIDNGNLTEVSISEVRAMYSTEGEPFRVDTDIVMKGYVSSSDKTGNFYKEIYLQDNFENPTTAIKVIINRTDLYNQFNKGREVYILLNPSNENGSPNGLYIGEERVGNGVITIGASTETDQFGTTVSSLGENMVTATMFRSANTMDIVPLNLSLSAISESHVGMFIQVDNVEFADNLAGERYFNSLENFDTQRTLQACEGASYTEISLETSSFSDFKNVALPIGNGTLGAVVSKTFDGSTVILALNTTDDVDLNNERCSLLTPIFFEDFQDAQDNSNLNTTGWVNFAEEGGEVWTEQLFQGIGTAEFSSFSTGDALNIGWLVSPGIDMDAQSNELLSFKTAQHHLDVDSDQNGIKVFVSTDFNGSDVLGATWEEQTAIFPNSDNSWYDLIGSGLIDLSSYTGTLHIAFRVTGSGTDSDLDGAFQIDDVAIVGN
ncbi:DUF5689 domain-containing protein [Winogradskyella sp.]|uniref:DUF5689 domain-containing protein n=1 Tax=Winogradskyella sp. TaxID=1883156 RepID=UPI0025D798AD|nr:DUF5689 domain-containing protein [Winogradskyella sp.]